VALRGGYGSREGAIREPAIQRAWAKANEIRRWSLLVGWLYAGVRGDEARGTEMARDGQGMRGRGRLRHY